MSPRQAAPPLDMCVPPSLVLELCREAGAEGLTVGDLLDRLLYRHDCFEATFRRVETQVKTLTQRGRLVRERRFIKAKHTYGEVYRLPDVLSLLAE